MTAELVHGSGGIDGDCLIYRWLHDTTLPGEALSPYLILLWLHTTGSVVVEDPRSNQTVWPVHAMAQYWGSGLSRSDTTLMDESENGQNTKCGDR